MYNGIGLLTPRGSGTSGHVQNSKFNLRGGPPNRQQHAGAIADMAGPAQPQPDKSILEHKSKRQVELAVAEEQAKLEDEGCALAGGGVGGRGVRVCIMRVGAPPLQWWWGVCAQRGCGGESGRPKTDPCPARLRHAQPA